MADGRSESAAEKDVRDTPKTHQERDDAEVERWLMVFPALDGDDAAHVPAPRFDLPSIPRHVVRRANN